MSSKHAIIFAFAVAGLSLVACSPSPALARPVIASAHSGSVYSQAVALLDSGRDYEAAAALLQTAIKSEPGNPAYHTALACAYADRAASLSYALCYRQLLAQLQAGYPKDLSDWQAAQADKTSSEYGEPRPTLPKPRVFLTKDDGRPLTLTDAQVIAQVTSLASQAQQEWQTGIRLSPPGSKRAAAEESYGWGLRLFERCQSGFFGSPNISGLTFSHDSTDDVWTQLSGAARDNPRNPDYWQSLGDEVWSTNGDGFLGAPLSDSASNMLWKMMSKINPADHPPGPGGNLESMLDAYRRSLALQPDNAALWARLFEMSRETKPDVALAMLRSASRYDPQSANLHYEAAELLFKKTPYGNIEDTPVDYGADALIPQVAKEATAADIRTGLLALKEIERGNSCGEYAAPVYRTPITTELSASWQYWSPLAGMIQIDFPRQARLRDVARQASGFSYVLAYNHQTDHAVRVANAISAMGEKMAGSWPTRDSRLGGGEILQTLVAMAVIAIGDHSLIKVAEISGDGDLINRSDDRWAAFQTRSAAYKKASRAQLAGMDVYGSLFDSY